MWFEGCGHLVEFLLVEVVAIGFQFFVIVLEILEGCLN